MRINWDQMTYDSGDYALGPDGNPVTGEIVSLWPDGTIHELQEFVDGMAHGRAIEYFEDGSVASEAIWQGGRRAGVHRSWHSNGRLAEELEFNQRGDLVRVTKWDEHGRLIDFTR
jgi:antitoxin component YwqK of YwqJK toxin-antitoxin module